MPGLTMLQLLHCNIGQQGWCALHDTDHNYGAWLGPPIEPAPILSVHNVGYVRHVSGGVNGAAAFHVTPPGNTRVIQPGDWT